MVDLREIIAKNICELRTGAGMTQSKLAEALNYSDKAISKWERAESVPDIAVLKQLADLFGVSVDYLLSDEHELPPPDATLTRTVKRNRFIVSSLAAMLVWLIATYVFIQMSISVPDSALLGHCIAAAQEQGWASHTGVVHSHESFYIDTNAEEEAYWSKCGVLGADMETAALFTIGRLRGIRTASILNNVVLYGQDTVDSIGGYATGEDMTAVGERREIAVALEALYRLAQEEA